MFRKKKVTRAVRAANRANGGKSTGPKTERGKLVSSLNGLGAGLGARPLWQPMITLGEDPSRYRALLQDVIRSCPPRSPLELRLCQDITRLMLKAERNQQAQEAKLVRGFEKLQSSRQRQRREMEVGASYDGPQSEVLKQGLLRAPDSTAKFSEAAACLERLREQIDSNFFGDTTELGALYGKEPTFRGAGIINGFSALARDPNDSEVRSSLRLLIEEEARNVAEAYKLYLQEHVEISRAMRLECLAPVDDPQYERLQRQEMLLDQQLERKMRLLLSLRAKRLDAGKDAEDSVQPEFADPLGWLEMAARSSKRLRLPKLDPDGLALAYKMDPSAVASKSGGGVSPEIIRKIREIYGLPPDPPPTPQRPLQPAEHSAAEGPAPEANQETKSTAETSSDS
jgi:hypothetical protein